MAGWISFAARAKVDELVAKARWRFARLSAVARLCVREVVSSLSWVWRAVLDWLA